MTPHDIFNARERIEREGQQTLIALLILGTAVQSYRRGFLHGDFAARPDCDEEAPLL